MYYCYCHEIYYFNLVLFACMYVPLMCLHFKPTFVYLTKVFYEILSKNSHFGVIFDHLGASLICITSCF